MANFHDLVVPQADRYLDDAIELTPISLHHMAANPRTVDSHGLWPPTPMNGRFSLTPTSIASVASSFREFCRLAEKDEVSSECFDSWIDAAGNGQLRKIMLRAVPCLDHHG